jgi:hypothetical protein
LKKTSRIASATSSVPTPRPTNVSQPPMLLTDSAHQARERIALRANRLAHPDEQALYREDLLQLLVARITEDLVLELVDPIVEVGEDGEEAVDQPVDDPVEQQRGTVDRLVALLVAPADLGKCGAIVPVDGDQEARRVEAVPSTRRSSSGEAP